MSDQPTTMTFEEMGLNYGKSMSLFCDPTDKNAEYECMLIGCLPGESVIIGPGASGVLPRLEEGQRVFVRAKLNSGVAIFPSIVLFVSEIPTIMVYLDFPEEIKFKRVRSALRVKTTLPVLGNNLDDTRFTTIAGKIVDISVVGAGLEMYEELGRPGQRIEIKGKFKLDFIQRMLTIPAVIRTCGQRDGARLYGVQFDDVEEDVLLMLFGFTYHEMAFKQIDSVR